MASEYWTIQSTVYGTHISKARRFNEDEKSNTAPNLPKEVLS